MAWNEKHARKTSARLVPQNEESSYKQKLDEEACREGNAIGFFKREELRPQLGRRAAREARSLDGARATMSHKAGKAEEKDTAEARRKYLQAEPRSLRQGPK